MEEFGPHEPSHQRIPWREEWKYVSVMIPCGLMQPLLRNDPPSTSEISQVQQFRDSLAEATKIHQEKTRLLYEELARLKEVEMQLHKQAHVCDIIMSPFRRIPDDIIYQIVTSDPLLPSATGYTDPLTHTPSIISRVSSSWRSVTHSIPSLWNRIHFDCRIWNYERTDVLFERISRFSFLSQPLPFTIRLNETCWDATDDVVRAIPFLFNPDDVGDLVLDLGLPRILKWLFGSWLVAQKRTTRLILDVSLRGQIHDVLIDETAAQHHLPLLDTLELSEWQGKCLYEQKGSASDFHALLKTLQELRCLWVSGTGSNRYRHYCHFFNQGTALGLPNYSNLRFLYLGVILHFEDWIQVWGYFPRLEGAWYHVSVPHQSSSTASRIQNDQIKVLTLQVHDPRSIGFGFSPPISPLFNLYLPSLEVLDLYLDNIHELKFVPTDCREAFPLLRAARARLRWTPHWPLELEDLTSFLISFGAISTTLVIDMSTQQIPEFANGLQEGLESVLIRPGHLDLNFTFNPFRGIFCESEACPPSFTKALAQLRQARKHKTTSIRFKHLQNYRVPLNFKDITDGHTNSTGLTNELYEDAFSARERERELKAMLSYFMSIQSELGEECVKVTTHRISEMWEDSSVAPLQQFKERYFT